MGELVFERLFKYRPATFSAAEWTFASGMPRWTLFVLLLLALAIARVGYPPGTTVRRTARQVLLVLRATALFLVLFALARPALRVKSVAEQQTFVGVIVDDSESMKIRDEGSGTRGDAALDLFLDSSSDIRRSLDRRFKTRVFRFARAADRLTPGAPDLTFSGPRTDIARALAFADQELQATPLSGLVLVTDGADNAKGPLSETLLTLRARGVPVFTVGLGSERFARDIEILRVEAPARVLQGSSVVASVTFRARGQGWAPLRLTAEDDGRILATLDIKDVSPESATARITIRADEPGERKLRFRLAEIEGEVVRENNRYDIALDVLGRREKLLYFEGTPRHEARFLRRAVRDDKNIQVVTLQRTANEKFLRLDVDTGEELATGFPKSREELFSYRGLVLGGVEASFFTIDQLRMISDFVGQRGGGLLMLGSDRSFAEGGYAGTAVADALPVVLQTPPQAPAGYGKRLEMLKVAVTPLGAAQPMTQIAANEAESARRFDSLPALSAVNRLERVKPGASALLVGRPENGLARENVVLAAQRFGRGRALALGVHDSWRWQMHADITADDLAHETLWRQLLRYLVSGATGPVTAILGSTLVEPGETVTVRADVSDETFVRVNDARTHAVVQAPDGATHDVPLHWTVDKDGEYRGEFRAAASGVYRIRVEARRNEKLLGEDETHVRAEVSPVEYQNGEMKPAVLKRIAAETGGRFYTAGNVSSLAEDLRYSPKTASVIEEKDLWDMPVIYILIAASLCGEWALRRLLGLA